MYLHLARSVGSRSALPEARQTALALLWDLAGVLLAALAAGWVYREREQSRNLIHLSQQLPRGSAFDTDPGLGADTVS
jgi:hypothetical protein